MRVVASTARVRRHAVAPVATPLCRWTRTAPRPPASKDATVRRTPSKAVRPQYVNIILEFVNLAHFMVQILTDRGIRKIQGSSVELS